MGMDPFEGSDFDPPSLHRYLYAAASPVNRRDPSGLFTLPEVTIVLSIRAVLTELQGNFGVALIDQALYGGTAGIESLAVGSAAALAGVGVAYGVSRLGLRLIRTHGFRRFVARIFRSKGVTPNVGYYGELVVTGIQRNHLNQDAAFGSVIPKNQGAAVGMKGNAFFEVGTPHYSFHRSLESWWDNFRPGGLRFGTLPTCAEYDVAMRYGLEAAGFDAYAVDALAEFARQNRRDFGLTDSSLVPRIPRRMNQS